MISLVICQLSHYYDVTSAKETKQESIFRLKLLQQLLSIFVQPLFCCQL